MEEWYDGDYNRHIDNNMYDTNWIKICWFLRSVKLHMPTSILFWNTSNVWKNTTKYFYNQDLEFATIYAISNLKFVKANNGQYKVHSNSLQ